MKNPVYGVEPKKSEVQTEPEEMRKNHLGQALLLWTFLSIACLQSFLTDALSGEGMGITLPSHRPHQDSMATRWEYMGVEGPQHWGMLTPEYQACESGNRQSPINIAMPQAGYGQEQLAFHYRPSHVHELNNGHTIQVSHLSGSRLLLNNQPYALRQFHFHVPSEHHIEGHPFPMEMHLVHQNPKGHIVVIAILMQADAEQPRLQDFWEWLPAQRGHEVSLPLQLNIGDLIPNNTHHYSYTGSLTTPPCSEGVHWLVLKSPIHVTHEEVTQFHHLIGNNARPLQPVLNRTIEEY